VSWHYLQGEEEVSSGHISWDGEQFVPSNLKSTLGGYSLPAKGMESCPDSPSGMMLQPSMEDPGGGELMWFQGDFPVRTYLPPARERESGEGSDQDSGPTWPGSLAKYNPHTYSWKTAQCSLFGGLISFSETFPRWGLMQDGELLGLTELVGITAGKESGLWPTIVKNEGPGGKVRKLTDAVAIAEGFRPRYYKPGQYPEREPFTGKVNPVWAEWLMGWPMGWTNALQPLEMAKFQQWLDLHGMSSPKASDTTTGE